MNLYSLRYANGKELCVKYKKSVYQSLVLITQFGINMIVPIFLCVGLGVFIYRRYGHPWLVILLFFLGAAAGFQICYRMAQRLWQKKDTGKVKSDVKKDK